MRDLYKKHHWQVAGPTFYQLHLLFDKHYEEQNELVDTIAERIQSLGGISLAMAADVAETTIIPRPPKGREEVPVQISRLLHAHEIVLKEARSMARQAAESGDDGTNDLLVSDLIRTNEKQVWFVSEHLVDVPLVKPTELWVEGRRRWSRWSERGGDQRAPAARAVPQHKWPVLTYGETPRADLQTWTFRCFGLVDQELSWTWKEFLALPRVDVTSDIHCETRWSRFDSRWEGSPSQKSFAGRAFGRRPSR